MPITPTSTAPEPQLLTRVALLEAKVRLITLVLQGMIVASVTALIAYFFK
jgi:hypothetical protein